MLNRRKVLFGAAALMAAALPAMPVMASDSRLLADILAGVSDALTRDYIRRHYQEGGWTAATELRRPPLHGRRVRPLLRSTTRSAASRRSRPGPRSRRSIRIPQKPGPQAGRNPPKGPGHDNGRHEGRKNDGRRDNWDGPR